MSQVQLRISTHPPQAEIFVRIRQKDGGYYTFIAVVDTGAEVSTLPRQLLEIVEHRVSQRGQVIIDQAGIAGQFFQGQEAYVKVYCEDTLGGRSQEFEILAWFVDSAEYLVGFGGVLERCVLHLDMPNLAGYLEF